MSCLWCESNEYRVVARGKTSRQQAAGHGEVSMEEYACTSRHHGQFFQVVECVKCRLRFLFPVPEAQEVEDAYTRVKDDEYLSIETPRRIAFTKLLQRLEKFVRPPGKLLDAGCYTGLFPALAQEKGWEAYGVEPSAWAARIAGERLPGKIFQGYLSNMLFPEEVFDIITSWDVIEHVTDPRKEIQRMAALLKPGGWLFLSTMHSEAFFVKLMGARWPWYMPMHLFYFTPTTLEPFVKEAGLKIVVVDPYPHYTTVQYTLWKLEPMLGPVAKALGKIAKRAGLAEKIIKIDMGDFFMLAAQKPIS